MANNYIVRANGTLTSSEQNIRLRNVLDSFNGDYYCAEGDCLKAILLIHSLSTVWQWTNQADTH